MNSLKRLCLCLCLLALIGASRSAEEYRTDSSMAGDPPGFSVLTRVDTEN